MKTNIKLAFIISLLFILQSCQKDPLKNINDGGWNNERSIIDIKFKGQIGSTVIDNIDSSTGRIDFSVNIAAVEDISKIEIEDMDISYQATASTQIGESLNFNNENRSAQISITSPTGKSRTYTIYMNEFYESLVGVWQISSMALYCGVEDSHNRTHLINFGTENGFWSENTNNPAAEYDNTLTITLDGVDDAGNTYGTCINDAGSDNKYADFIFKNNNDGKYYDVSDKYRKIPIGKSKWIRNYTKGTITFIDEDNNEYEAAFENAGTIQLSDLNAPSANDIKITIPEHAFSYSYPLAWDYTDEYNDYGRVVLNPRKLFILVNKIN